MGVLLVAVSLVGMVVRGYALSVLWGWFMVSTLGLPRLSVVSAIGVALVIRFMTGQDTSDIPRKEQSNKEKIRDRVAYATLYPLIVLFLGWVIHRYM